MGVQASKGPTGSFSQYVVDPVVSKKMHVSAAILGFGASKYDVHSKVSASC